MNYSEQELAREVLHLHSLWHQGPPNSNHNFSSHHIPYHDHTFYRRPSSNRTRYSRPYPNPNPSICYNDYRSSHLTPERSNEKLKRESTPEKEWPCDPASVPEKSSPHAWAPFEQAVQTPPTLSPNSAARADLMSMQLSAIQSCKGFFSQDSDSESEYESESENDVDEFFSGLFEKDADLRSFYEKDHENGEFYCLVCETRRDGKKRKGKMYRGCAALAQHASAVSKVGRRAAHLAFARTICLALGWDPQRLPSIVLLPGSVVKADHSENSKGKDSGQEENFENDVNEDPQGIVLKMVDYTGSKEEQAGTTSGSPVEEKKEGTSFDT
ncbi:hypothetical protein FCM35_KLT21787 [Carex littledalei]|uniref:Uncharacterized protein n=1 Tax=Carex littledalei TaxID=544730 RepID=A0A833VDC3_9POAL|nr:hypothetical protein FCM35_KLT21787 [Carex littledalei]